MRVRVEIEVTRTIAVWVEVYGEDRPATLESPAECVEVDVDGHGYTEDGDRITLTPAEVEEAAALGLEEAIARAADRGEP